LSPRVSEIVKVMAATSMPMITRTMINSSSENPLVVRLEND